MYGPHPTESLGSTPAEIEAIRANLDRQRPEPEAQYDLAMQRRAEAQANLDRLELPCEKIGRIGRFILKRRTNHYEAQIKAANNVILGYAAPAYLSEQRTEE